jgi:hypothetical protein
VLPHPFTSGDTAAGYRYELSVLQAEFSLTQTLDAAVNGRIFFDQLIRDNLDLGRPDRVSLIFDRRVVRRGKRPTPGRFRTRVITDGVTPSLHIDYKNSKIKQYHKLGKAPGRGQWLRRLRPGGKPVRRYELRGITVSDEEFRVDLPPGLTVTEETSPRGDFRDGRPTPPPNLPLAIATVIGRQAAAEAGHISARSGRGLGLTRRVDLLALEIAGLPRTGSAPNWLPCDAELR